MCWRAECRREGWSVVDDSNSACGTTVTQARRGGQSGQSGQQAPEPGAGGTCTCSASGTTIAGGMQEFTAIAGRIPMMPWRSYGVRFSRYWPYNETGVRQLVADHESNGLALNIHIGR